MHHWSKSHLKEEARETKRDKERRKETDIRRIQTKSKIKERERNDLYAQWTTNNIFSSIKKLSEIDKIEIESEGERQTDR